MFPQPFLNFQCLGLNEYCETANENCLFFRLTKLKSNCAVTSTDHELITVNSCEITPYTSQAPTITNKLLAIYK